MIGQWTSTENNYQEAWIKEVKLNLVNLSIYYPAVMTFRKDAGISLANPPSRLSSNVREQ